MSPTVWTTFWPANRASGPSPCLTPPDSTPALPAKSRASTPKPTAFPQAGSAHGPFVQFSVAAGNMLVKDSGLVIDESNAARVSVILGVGLGGLHTIEVFHSRLVEAGPNKVSPFMIPMLISNMAPGQVAIATGAKGANMVLTSACASGTHAVGMGFTEIVMGRCDACITGGVEATVTPMGISGFTSLKALSTSHNDEPERRPVPSTRTATASSWARARASSCSKALSTLRRAARPSTPKSWAPARPTTPSPHDRPPRRRRRHDCLHAPRHRGRGRQPRCGGPHQRPRHLHASERPLAKPTPSSRSSASAPTTSPSLRPSPRPGTCSARRVGWRRSSPCSPCTPASAPGTIRTATRRPIPSAI